MTDQTTMQTLTSYDWVAKENPSSAGAYVVDIAEQDYDQGVQRVKIAFSDGSSVIQTRRWRDDASHANWFDMPGTNAIDSMAEIEHSSFLLREDTCEPFKTGTELEIFMRGVYGPLEVLDVTTEAYMADDELDARTQKYLTDTNQMVNENNEIVQHINPEDIRQLALEFRMIDLNIKDYMAAVAGKFNKITEAFRQYSVNAIRVKSFRYDSIKTRKLAGNLDRVPYNVLVDLGVFVVPGQIVTYLTLIDALKLVGDVTTKAISEDFESFIRSVGYLVNNPKELSSVRKVMGEPKYNLDKAKAALSACFDNSNRTNVSYGTVVERNADWQEIRTQLDRLLDYYDLTPPTKVKELVDSVTPNLDNIYQVVGQGREIASKQNMEALADWCYHSAQLVELYAAYTNVLRTLLVAIDDTSDKLIKTVKHY